MCEVREGISVSVRLGRLYQYVWGGYGGFCYFSWPLGKFSCSVLAVFFYACCGAKLICVRPLTLYNVWGFFFSDGISLCLFFVIFSHFLFWWQEFGDNCFCCLSFPLLVLRLWCFITFLFLLINILSESVESLLSCDIRINRQVYWWCIVNCADVCYRFMMNVLFILCRSIVRGEIIYTTNKCYFYIFLVECIAVIINLPKKWQESNCQLMEHLSPVWLNSPPLHV